MMRFVILIPVALLAACGSEPNVDARNATVEDVAEKVANAGGSDNFVRPGKWRSQVRIEQFEIPGAPPEVAESMRGVHERAQTTETCLTAEQAKRPKEDFFAGAGKNCRYEHFTMGGGKIDAVMKCTADGMAQTMAMQGTYAPDSYQMQMSLNARAQSGPSGEMRMKMRVDARRIGECDKKSA